MSGYNDRIRKAGGGTPLRYEKAEELLRLVLHLQGSSVGLTMAELRHRLGGASRRTVERMLRAAERLFPALEEVPSTDRLKRWRIPTNGGTGLATVTADELAALETATTLLRRENIDDHADRVERLAASLRTGLHPTERRRLEPDLEAVCEAEGFAFRPGPRPNVDSEVIDALRFAIKACRRVRITYVGRSTRRESRQLVCPYGFLFGSRHYLVAYNLNRQSRGYRNFALSNIRCAEVTTDAFARDREFSLKAYAKRSFGVFQEEPFNVVWRFSPAVAADAKEFMFHPSQKIEEQLDGSLIVKFRAGGTLEMCWHLFTWGDHVEVVSPKRLVSLMKDVCRRWGTCASAHRCSRSEPVRRKSAASGE